MSRTSGELDLEFDKITSQLAIEGTEAVSASVPTPLDPHLWRSLRRPLSYFLISRVVVLLAGLVTAWRIPRLHLLRAMTGWDGYWYTKIAQHGYPNRVFNEADGSRWAFFPAYPSVVRVTVDLTGLSYANAELALSFVFGLTSVVAIWLAVRSVFGTAIADRSVLLYVCFPTAFVLNMAYTEGLFLTAAAACLYALSRRMWVSAAAFAIIASLTRNAGVFLVVCVMVVAVLAVLKEPKLRPIVAFVMSPLGLFAWMLYSWRKTGTPLAFVKAEQFFGENHFRPFLTPFQALGRLLTSVHSWTDWPLVMSSAAVIFVIFGIDFLRKAHKGGTHIPVYWWIFTIGSVIGALSPYLPNSELRYTMAAFPLIAALAGKLRPKSTAVLAAIMLASQALLFGAVLVGTLHQTHTIFWP
jgi:hypothetical protein